VVTIAVNWVWIKWTLLQRPGIPIKSNQMKKVTWPLVCRCFFLARFLLHLKYSHAIFFIILKREFLKRLHCSLFQFERYIFLRMGMSIGKKGKMWWLKATTIKSNTWNDYFGHVPSAKSWNWKLDRLFWKSPWEFGMNYALVHCFFKFSSWLTFLFFAN
jgi:hypothetical protein